MIIKKKHILIKLLILSILSFSCDSNNIHKELDSWCNCEKQALETPEVLDSCNQLMIDISIKYEFDPESVSFIRKKVKNCL